MVSYKLSQTNNILAQLFSYLFLYLTPSTTIIIISSIITHTFHYRSIYFRFNKERTNYRNKLKLSLIQLSNQPNRQTDRQTDRQTGRQAFMNSLKTGLQFSFLYFDLVAPEGLTSTRSFYQ